MHRSTQKPMSERIRQGRSFQRSFQAVSLLQRRMGAREVKYLVIDIWIEGKHISKRTIPTDNVLGGYEIHDDLLGIDISKNAMAPSDLMIIIEEIESQ